MAFNSADRFGYEIVLPFREGVRYRVPSPPVEVGNFMVESAQLTRERVTLLMESAVLAEQLEEAGKAGDDEQVAQLTGQLEDNRDRVADLTDRLTIPDEVQGDYFASILGPAYAEMCANREPFELVKLAASTVSVWVLQGRDEAEAYWNSGGRPSRPPKAPADHKRKRSGRRSQNRGTSR